jgi:hypothetical protein
MKQFCSLVMFGSMAVCTAAPLALAQATRTSNWNIGIAWQNDNLYQRGVRVSPIGLAAGLGWQPAFGNGHVGFVDQIGLFPALRNERFSALPAGVDPDTAFDKGPLLAVNTAVIRLWSGDPAGSRGANWFLGSGVAAALVTPRRGHRIVPTFTAGVRSRLNDRLGLETSVACNAPRLGKSVCVVPLTLSLPLR